MPLFETESIVLKSYSLAEADRIVVFLTREHGIVRGVAKGAKRLKSRFGSTLEPFSTVYLEYFQKEDRELASIQRVDLLRSCFESAGQPGFLQTFSYIADLLTAFVPPHDPNETLYRMVKACIESADSPSPNFAAIRLYFELWLLRIGGYLPDWSACNICKRVLTSSETAHLQADFQLLCSDCRRSQSNQIISPRHREVFQLVQRLDPKQFLVFASDKPESISDVSNVLKRIISNVIGREVASEKSFAVNF
jgi:DNA repair protein RecO (recombination protein O)